MKDLSYKEFYEINHGINIDKTKKELKELIMPVCGDEEDDDLIDEPTTKDYKKLNFVKNNYRVILDNS